MELDSPQLHQDLLDRPHTSIREPGLQPPADPAWPRRLGTPQTSRTLINPGSSSPRLLLAGPGQGSPAQGEVRALDRSHTGRLADQETG